MPGLDRTGPNSEGPKTGWGMGRCNPETRDQIDESDIVPERRRRLGDGWQSKERLGGKGMGRGGRMRHRRGMGRGQGWGKGPGSDAE